MSETVSADDEPIIEVENMSKHFPAESGFIASLLGTDDVQAVDDVSLEIQAGETLALVGESGCGKSTLARAILQLDRPTDGTVRYKGQDLTSMSASDIRPLRQDMQMIFQDPHSSLDPRMKVGQIVEEPMQAHDILDDEGRTERARVLLEKVGLEAGHYHRYPHEFSGGQRQRVNLARAFSTDPEVIMCDEPTSALDVSVQAQVLNVMDELQKEFDVTYLFISHDMSVVRYIADRVAVMYLGHVVEVAEKEELFENPQHPYTRALLDAIPVPDPAVTDGREPLEGDVPSPIDPPSGCRFRTRCPRLIRPGEYEIDRDALDEEVEGALLSSYDMSDPEWSNVRSFVRAVSRRTFSLDDSDSRATAKRYVDEEFFHDGRPSGDPGRVVDESIALIADGEWEEAATLLRISFTEPSICATQRPSYVVETEYGENEHFAACHLHREE